MDDPVVDAVRGIGGVDGAAVAFYPVVIVGYFEEEPPPVSVVALCS